MKKRNILLLLAALALVGVGGLVAQSVTAIYMQPGGGELVVGSGGKITVQSGGEIELQSGAVMDSQSGATARLALAAKTTDYTVTSADYNKVFTTRGAAGAVTFTLPAAAAGNAGAWVEFYSVAGQNLTVAGADEGLVVFNDLTADAIACSTAGELIGCGFRAVSDGTSWIVVPLATETQTVTVTSA